MIIISTLHKNIMGMTSFEAKFEGMRKAQEFDVYPIKGGDDAKTVTIQSDTRIGTVNLDTGDVQITRSIPSGAFFHHLALVQPAGKLSTAMLNALKLQVFTTASKRAGEHFVVSDNSGAAGVFA